MGGISSNRSALTTWIVDTLDESLPFDERSDTDSLYSKAMKAKNVSYVLTSWYPYEPTARDAIRGRRMIPGRNSKIRAITHLFGSPEGAMNDYAPTFLALAKDEGKTDEE